MGLHLVLGGARSGKSAFAESAAREISQEYAASTLKSDGPFTVFAPSDEAFAALPDGTLEALLAEDGLATLTSILTYHVVPGKVMSTDILGQKLEAATAAGVMVAIDATMGSVMVGGAKVITADIETSNGVIHVIDAVILPPAAN